MHLNSVRSQGEIFPSNEEGNATNDGISTEAFAAVESSRLQRRPNLSFPNIEASREIPQENDEERKLFLSDLRKGKQAKDLFKSGSI